MRSRAAHCYSRWPRMHQTISFEMSPRVRWRPREKRVHLFEWRQRKTSSAAAATAAEEMHFIRRAMGNLLFRVCALSGILIFSGARIWKNKIGSRRILRRMVTCIYNFKSIFFIHGLRCCVYYIFCGVL
jgi:hypothetical protein